VACTKIAVDFQNLQRANADECIKQSLAILREATSADGAFSAFLGASGSHIESVMVAGGQFAQLHPEGLRGVTLERLPYLAARTEHLRLSEFRDTAAPRPDQGPDANLFAELSIGAALLVAFRIPGKPAGFLGLLFGLPRATFDVNLQLLLKLLGSSLALGLERVRLSLTLDQLEARSQLGELAANDGLWDFDVEAQETYFSPRWRAMLGYDTVELHRNFDWRTLVHVEDAQRVQNAIRDHVAGKTPMFESVHRMRHHNGEWRWVQSRAKATVDPHGACCASLASSSTSPSAGSMKRPVPREGERADHVAVDRRWRGHHQRRLGDRLHQPGGGGTHRLATRGRDASRSKKFSAPFTRDLRGAENPLTVAIRRARAIKSVRPMLLIRRDGNELYVESTAAPIRDGAGRTAGGVLYFTTSASRAAEPALELHASQTCSPDWSTAASSRTGWARSRAPRRASLPTRCVTWTRQFRSSTTAAATAPAMRCSAGSARCYQGALAR
jgi:PAS domain S-box-containing protein